MALQVQYRGIQDGPILGKTMCTRALKQETARLMWQADPRVMAAPCW